jgi:carbon storage regulator CsrA
VAERAVEESAVLVLSRKIGESISIGEGIEVVVNRISGNRVTLGIKAPANVRIVRGELDRFPAGAAGPLETDGFQWSPAMSVR